MYGRFFRELFTYRELLRNLVATDLKLKYRNSFLGLFWSLLHPALRIALYAAVFQIVIRFEMDSYAFFLLTGMVPWLAFVGAMNSSTSCIVKKACLLKQARFPLVILPMAEVAIHLCQFGLTMVAFLPFLLYWKEDYSAVNLLFPVALFFFFLLTTGLALILGTLSVYFQDLTHLTEVIFFSLFWASGVIYPAVDYQRTPPDYRIPQEYLFYFRLNPLASFMEIFRQTLYFDMVPSLRQFLYVAAISVAVLAAGLKLFYSLEPNFIEEL